MNLLQELTRAKEQLRLAEDRHARNLQKQAEQHAVDTAVLNIKYKYPDLLPDAEQDIRDSLSFDGKQYYATPGRLPDAPPEACGTWQEIGEFFYKHSEFGPSCFESLNPAVREEREGEALKAAGLPANFKQLAGDPETSGQAIAAVRQLMEGEKKL